MSHNPVLKIPNPEDEKSIAKKYFMQKKKRKQYDVQKNSLLNQASFMKKLEDNLNNKLQKQKK